MEFNVRLGNLIEESNVTQRQLAFDLHIANSTINGYITGYREPDFAMLIRLAAYFDVSTDYLLGLCDEKRPAPSSLSNAEAELIHLYRSLNPEHRQLLSGQAKFYYSLPKSD